MTRTRRPSPQTVAVLDALAVDPSSWAYGYDICRSIGLKAGTVYPILIRLAERGQVEATWETDPPPGRPPRHLYRISAAGVRALRDLETTQATVLRQGNGATAAEASS
jgi:DNA-binding PadR family transcriptional regulator